MRHIPILFAFALVAWAQTPKPGVIVGGNASGGGGGSYTAGTGLSLIGDQFSINTAVTARKLDMQSGAPNYCRSTTGNDTYVCALTPTLTAYTRGGCVVLDPDTANTLTATIDVDTLGAKSILNRAGAALSTGDITANKPITICYDGTQYIVQGDGGGGATTKSNSITLFAQVAPATGTIFQSLGTGYTNPTLGATGNPTRGNFAMEPNAGTPWGFLMVYRLPESWQSAGTTSLTIGSFSSGTVNDRTWSVETWCMGAGDTANGTPSWSTAQTVTFTPVANVWSSTALTLDSTSLASCAAGEIAHFRITRSDANAGTQRIVSVSLAWQESL